jgi:ABC-type branched-subunit amino acid transport system ATPase component
LEPQDGRIVFPQMTVLENLERGADVREFSSSMIHATRIIGEVSP